MLTPKIPRFMLAVKQEYPESNGLLDMIVGQEFRRQVGYVVEQVWNENRGVLEFVEIGTVFVVAIWAGATAFQYLVTCGHVILTDAPAPSPLFIRFNQKDGTAYNQPCERSWWEFDEDSDIAVMKMPYWPHLNCWSYPIDEASIFSQVPLQPGTAVFLVGLFSPDPGSSSVDALVRTGTVARGKGKINTQVSMDGSCRLIDAFLVQTLAWGGESGSPVFAYTNSQELDVAQLSRDLVSDFAPSRDLLKPAHAPTLIGMIQGHFLAPSGSVDVNAGIAIVVPVWRIQAILDRPKYIEERRIAQDKHREAMAKRTRPLSRQVGRLNPQPTTADPLPPQPSPESPGGSDES